MVTTFPAISRDGKGILADRDGLPKCNCCTAGVCSDCEPLATFGIAIEFNFVHRPSVNETDSNSGQCRQRVLPLAQFLPLKQAIGGPSPFWLVKEEIVNDMFFNVVYPSDVNSQPVGPAVAFIGQRTINPYWIFQLSLRAGVQVMHFKLLRTIPPHDTIGVATEVLPAILEDSLTLPGVLTSFVAAGLRISIGERDACMPKDLAATLNLSDFAGTTTFVLTRG